MTVGNAKRWRIAVRALVYLGAGIAAEVDRAGLVGALHDVTGGTRPADVVAGVLAVWAPLLLLVGGQLLARRVGDRAAGWLRRCGWWCMLPWVAALALTPYSREGTDQVLLGQLRRQLPGFVPGLVAGTAVLAGPALVLVLIRRARRRRRLHGGPPGSTLTRSATQTGRWS